MPAIINRKFVSHETATHYFRLLVNVLEEEGGNHAHECPYYAECNAPACPLVDAEFKALDGEPSCAFHS